MNAENVKIGYRHANIVRDASLVIFFVILSVASFPFLFTEIYYHLLP